MNIFYQTHAGALDRVLPSLTLLQNWCYRISIRSDGGCQEQLFYAPRILPYQDTSSTRHAYFAIWYRSFSSRVVIWFMLLKELQLERVTLEDDKQFLHAPRNLRCLEELKLLRT